MNMLEKIKILMSENDIKNLHQLAERSGIPYGTVDSLFRKDYKKAKLSTLNKLKDCLNCNLDFLLNDEITEKKEIVSFDGFNIEEEQFINNFRQLDLRQKQTVSNVIKSQLNLKTDEKIKTLKIFDHAACAGNGLMVDSEDYELVEFSNPPVTASFCVKIQGDSMLPLIEDGQVVFVQNNISLQPGDIGIVCYQGETMCKVIKHKNGGLILSSLNKKYEDKTVYSADDITIIGRVL